MICYMHCSAVSTFSFYFPCDISNGLLQCNGKIMTAEITLNNSTTPNVQEQHSASQSFNDTTAVGLPRATLRCIASFHLTGGKMAYGSCGGFIGWAAGSLKATAGAHGHRGRVTAWREDIAIRPGRAKPPTGFGLDWNFPAWKLEARARRGATKTSRTWTG